MSPEDGAGDESQDETPAPSDETPKRDRRLGIKCRYCKSTNTRVRNSYPNGIRMRYCLSCKRPFRTLERPA